MRMKGSLGSGPFIWAGRRGRDLFKCKSDRARPKSFNFNLAASKKGLDFNQEWPTHEPLSAAQVVAL